MFVFVFRYNDTKFPFSQEMRYTVPMRHVGIDYGVKHIGISMSDAEGKFAFPHTVVPNNEDIVSVIGEIVRENDIGTIVVGDARAFSGDSNQITQDVEEFVRVLKEEVGVPVVLVPEAWSSVEARRFSGEARANDASAAAIILQRFLDGVSK